jgi:hypothetical protein
MATVLQRAFDEESEILLRTQESSNENIKSMLQDYDFPKSYDFYGVKSRESPIKDTHNAEDFPVGIRALKVSIYRLYSSFCAVKQLNSRIASEPENLKKYEEEGKELLKLIREKMRRTKPVAEPERERSKSQRKKPPKKNKS